MSVSYTDITKRFPEFADVDPSTIETHLGDATLSINREAFGDKADIATIYLAAHMLALSSVGKGGGRITSEKVGDLSRTYAGGAADKSEPLAETKYGMEFMRIRRSVVTSPCVITQSGSLDA